MIRCLSVILDTLISERNKINAIYAFDMPLLTYLLPVNFFSQKDLNYVDHNIYTTLIERNEVLETAYR